MTRKFLFKSLLLSCILMGATACSDEQTWPVVDGKSPQVDLAMTRIRTDYDLTFTIKGKIADEDGISKIHLDCPGLSLNKTIDIIDIYQKPLTEYDLDYSYTINQDRLSDFVDAYTVTVTVTDVAGNTESKEVLVTLDADFEAPVFLQFPGSEITVLIKDKTVYNLKFIVEDNRTLDFVEINLEGVEGYPIRIDAQGEPKIQYSQQLELPSTPKDYKLTITAQDMPAQDDVIHTTVIESNVKVQHLPDWDRLYLADVTSAEDLNSDVFGVPMACDHVGPYQYRVRYYNEKAGTQVCFIPQRTDFYPICFGPDPFKEGYLGDDPEMTGKINLDKAGVYYYFYVNTKTGEYSYTTYPVSEAHNPVENLIYGADLLNTWGEWDEGAGWWQEWYFGPSYTNPKEIEVRMTQDPKNPNIWISDDWQLEAGETKEWVLHNWHHDGWWDYTSWRMDDSAEPSRCFYYGYAFKDHAKFHNNKAYFDYKYVNVDPTEFKYMYPRNGGAPFNFDSWGMRDDNYPKLFVDDIKVKCNVPKSGKYRLWFDSHSEHIKLLPVTKAN